MDERMSPRVDDIEASLVRLVHVLDLVGARVGVRAIEPADAAHLRPEEAEALAGAVASRRHEFASGRALLRRLLAADVAMPVGADRRPVLPDGWTATLAHDAELVCAVVHPALSTGGTRCTIGVDTERVGAVAPDLASTVLRHDEAWLAALPDGTTIGFCLKEAVYKAWSNAGGRFLEHHDVRLLPTGAQRAVAGVDANHLDVAWDVVAGHVVAFAVSPAPVT
jgi:4'-phosphopantetheinyl transferase EntD